MLLVEFRSAGSLHLIGGETGEGSDRVIEG